MKKRGNGKSVGKKYLVLVEKKKKETSVPPNVGNYKTKLIFKTLFS